MVLIIEMGKLGGGKIWGERYFGGLDWVGWGSFFLFRVKGRFLVWKENWKCVYLNYLKIFNCCYCFVEYSGYFVYLEDLMFVEY